LSQALVIQFPPNRKKPLRQRTRAKVNGHKKGRVYERGGKLWVDFYYLKKRIREPSGLVANEQNRKQVRRQLDLIVAEIENGKFIFAERFPHSSKRDEITRLEGRDVHRRPDEVIFGEYVVHWLAEMNKGMTKGQSRDYACALNNHILPYFGKMTFREINSVIIKRFIVRLQSYKTKGGQHLSPKTVINYLIPLRVVFRDAVIEHEWDGVTDPFRAVRLPKVPKKRIQPFNYKEWAALMERVMPWYRPYFEFAAQTGLRPSEQVALKWDAIDDEFVHVELSRVRNREKADLKTSGSVRRIQLRSYMAQTLEAQRALSCHFCSPYVFVTTMGLPIRQENLGKRWTKAFDGSDIRYRRMYETRHTFASWALAAGESPEWVARTLGHVDTSMVYRVYGRYIPNLTRNDGSAFEQQYWAQMPKK
jgi:integrase